MTSRQLALCFVVFCALTAGLLVGSGPGWAVPTCTPLGFAGDCNLLITIGPGGTPSTSLPLGPGTAYDEPSGGDDQYVGVLNHSSGVIASITLSGIDIFHFDGDGAFGVNCAHFSSPPYSCGTGGGKTGYESSTTSFSGITLGDGTSTQDIGTVNFLGGLGAGNLGLFSLEAPATLCDLEITHTQLDPVPEPSTIWLVGSSGSATLLWAWRRRKSA